MNNSEAAESAFRHVISALEQQQIDFSKCSLFNDIHVHIDNPNGLPRFTYVMFDPINNKKIIAQCVILFVRIVEDGNKKWQIGWCVDENFREQGIGYNLANKAIQEFSHTYNKKINNDYIEANVDENNIASIQISRKLIGNEELLINQETGENAYSFMRQFKF